MNLMVLKSTHLTALRKMTSHFVIDKCGHMTHRLELITFILRKY